MFIAPESLPSFANREKQVRQIRVDRFVFKTRFPDTVTRAEAVVATENAVSLGAYPADVPLSVGKECNLFQES